MSQTAGRYWVARGAMLLGAVSSMPAAAVSIQSVSVINTYSYTFGDTAAPETQGGERSTYFLSDQRPIPTSQLGVDYVGQANVNSFYFLHNDYCVGKCQITSSTTIRFELFNDEGRDLDGLRFNSLITPGHLALVGLGDYADTSAHFDFSVTRTDIPLSETDVTVPQTLYNAQGFANADGLTVVSDDNPDPFNSTIKGDNGGAGLYYDWSATPLNVELGAVSTRQAFFLDYTASYTVNSYNTCDDILNCNAAQVIFGDPRNNGGGSENIVANPDLPSFARSLARTLALGADPLIDGGVHAVITRDYGASTIPYEFVPSGTDPSFATPSPRAPITYSLNYLPNLTDTNGTPAVPEPATWMSMMLGFGLIGAALRRRTVALRFAR